MLLRGGFWPGFMFMAWSTLSTKPAYAKHERPVILCRRKLYNSLHCIPERVPQRDPAMAVPQQQKCTIL
jgi:hypothetical protein